MWPWWAAACLLAARGGTGLSLQRSEGPADGGKPECPHETCRISSAFQKHIERTRDVVASWEVRAAPANGTDRVAATIFQPETPEAVELFSYAIRANMHRLGPEWSLLVFYGSDAGREMLDEALGRPASVIWRPVMLEGKRQANITKQEANWFRLSMDFWGQVPGNLRHVLVFESDSLLLRGPGCVEEFFGYSYVGAPWNTSTRWGRRLAFPQGGNGGLSLRRLEDMIATVRSEFNRKNLDYVCVTYNPKRPCPEGRPKARFPQNEDGEMVEMLTRMASDGESLYSDLSFPGRRHAFKFAVEQVFHPSPCGLHNPWEYLSGEQAEELLGSAQMG